MPIRLSCPSCNTAFSLPELPADRRANCPRCGDQFPVRTFTEIEDETWPRPAGTAPPYPKARAQWSVKRTVLVALGMGAIGLVVGIVGYSLRGDPQPKPQPEPAPIATAIPASQLAGLGYLPADDNIVFAVQTGPILAYAERAKKDPRELIIQAGVPDKVYDGFTSLGLSLAQIEHVAGGTYFGDAAWSVRLTLVLVLRTPLANEDDFLRKLKAKKHALKQRYEVELSGVPLMLARISPVLWVFGWEDSDFQAVEKSGFGPGGVQFNASLSRTIAERIPPSAAAWLATSDEQWAEKAGVKLLLGEMLKKKDWLPVLARGRSALMTLSLEEPPRLRLFINASDDATGEQLRGYFQRQAGTRDQVQFGGGGQLAYYDTPIDPMTVYETIARLLSDAAKK